ncbi:MAG: hypothetical protein HC886_00770 [Leptolyngbyaceae cyanobacterium SM1_1_3]|nr:hypothetical protein [Leptolyngbyaceae cyanobacterium SM1_1_3]NJN01002.1 hypothetical protein [Leptolyngbyaceae cyanobacterium RM1_1_2]NJO10717.1 hypothetical protein [Leptolyngbyaceae cyanobacterium SL_1_1]
MKLRTYAWSSLLSLGLLLGTAAKSPAQIALAQTAKTDTATETIEFRPIEQPPGLKLGVSAAGVGLIGLELWWFLFSKAQN